MSRAVAPEGKGALRPLDNETLQEVRADLASLLREEIDAKIVSGSLDEHADEFLAQAEAQMTDEEGVLRVAWRVDPYSIEAVFEKPQEAVDADDEGLGTEMVHELDAGRCEVVSGAVSDRLVLQKPWRPWTRHAMGREAMRFALPTMATTTRTRKVLAARTSTSTRKRRTTMCFSR